MSSTPIQEKINQAGILISQILSAFASSVSAKYGHDKKELEELIMSVGGKHIVFNDQKSGGCIAQVASGNRKDQVCGGTISQKSRTGRYCPRHLTKEVSGAIATSCAIIGNSNKNEKEKKTCMAQLTSGKNKGTICGKKASDKSVSGCYCGRHIGLEGKPVVVKEEVKKEDVKEEVKKEEMKKDDQPEENMMIEKTEATKEEEKKKKEIESLTILGLDEDFASEVVNSSQKEEKIEEKKEKISAKKSGYKDEADSGKINFVYITQDYRFVLNKSTGKACGVEVIVDEEKKISRIEALNEEHRKILQAKGISIE